MAFQAVLTHEIFDSHLQHALSAPSGRVESSPLSLVNRGTDPLAVTSL